MPFRLVAPLVQDFVLEDTDKFFGIEGDPSRVTIRQATQDQNARRHALTAPIERHYDSSDADQTIRLRQTWDYEDLRRLEVYLTLVGCNLLDENQQMLFKFKKDSEGRPILDMTEGEFNKAWGKLPPLVAHDIHSKVRLVNLTWGGPEGE